ncbi:Integrase core domain-containing protein, partial [Eubacterium pyruvativorans]
FVGVLTYSQYTYVEAFMNERTGNWIRAHVHMFEFFGGVTPMLVADNCTTAVDHRKSDWYTPVLNTTYHEMAEHYNIAILPARVRRPKDKPNVEGSVGKISTWITAAFRNEQFFSLAELNSAIRKKLNIYIEVFYNHDRIASHRRLHGRRGHYSTVTEHMPDDHQDRHRKR